LLNKFTSLEIIYDVRKLQKVLVKNDRLECITPEVKFQVWKGGTEHYSPTALTAPRIVSTRMRGANSDKAPHAGHQKRCRNKAPLSTKSVWCRRRPLCTPLFGVVDGVRDGKAKRGCGRMHVNMPAGTLRTFGES
jgi:hypothetical protein